MNRRSESKIRFTERDVKFYLDRCIENFNDQKKRYKGEADQERIKHYMDAFQSVRISLFAEKWVEKVEKEDEPRRIS